MVNVKKVKNSVEVVQVSKRNFSIMTAITSTEVLGCQVIEFDGTKKKISLASSAL